MAGANLITFIKSRWSVKINFNNPTIIVSTNVKDLLVTDREETYNLKFKYFLAKTKIIMLFQ